MIKYNFKQESAVYSEAINTLLRKDVGLLSGGEIASLFYTHYVEGISIKEMGIKSRNYKYLISIILRANGAYAGSKQLFDYCLMYFPEQLDRLFKVDVIAAPAIEEEKHVKSRSA